MTAGLLLRILQAVFILTAVILIFPTVSYTVDNLGGNTGERTCETRRIDDDTTDETCRVPISTGTLTGISYGLMSVSAGVVAVALRPGSRLGRRTPGPAAPVPAGPPPGQPGMHPTMPPGPGGRPW